MSRKFDLHGNDILAMCKLLFKKQTQCMRIDNNFSEYIKYKYMYEEMFSQQFYLTCKATLI